MKLSVELLPEVEKDIEIIKNSFSNEDPLKAQDFLIQLTESIEYLSNNPMLFPKIFQNIRQASISKFPFKINFIFESKNKKVIVLNVLKE